MDSILAVMASVLAWLVLPIWVHLVINTFVFGVMPPWIKKGAATKGNTKFAMSQDKIKFHHSECREQNS